MSRRVERVGSAAVVLALVSFAAFAADARVENLRPKGPIKVTARHAEFDERGKRMLYRGRVRLVSDELELQGDRMELERAGKGVYKAYVTGSPARLTHAGTADVPELSARAKEIVYDSEGAAVALNGEAVVTRGADELIGDHIRYDAATRRIRATAADGGRIRLVIEQPDSEEEGDENP